MSVFQAFAARLFGWLMNSPVMLGHWGFQIFRRPLIAGMICGLVMGDVTKGVMVGAVLQALYIGTMNVGGIASMPPIDISQWFAISLALASGRRCGSGDCPGCAVQLLAQIFAGFADERQSNYIAQSG